MSYTVILFDADGTLFDYEKAEAYALMEALRLFLGEERREYLPVYQDVNRSIWKDFEDGHIKAHKINQERFHRFFQRTGLNLDVLSFCETYLTALGRASFLLDGALHLLQALKGYRLILITNGLSKVQHSRLEKAGLKDYFESIIISEEVGVAKPKEAIFAKALESIDFQDKKKALMVGDNLKTDIGGGIAFGVNTCWYNPRQEENQTSYQPTYEIYSLLELLAILKD